MKKMFLVLGVAAAAMTSCTSDEVLEMNPTNTIKFESFVNKGTRTVTDVYSPTDQTNPLRKFHVYGSRQTTDNVSSTNTPVWGGAMNTVNYDNGTWTNSQHEIWKDGTYSFVAYANGANADAISSGVSYDEATQTLTIGNYTVDSEIDLIGAFAQAPNKYQPVDLTFKHLLTKVSFEFTNSYTAITGATMNITDLKVIDSYSTGTCTLNNDCYSKISKDNALTTMWQTSGQQADKNYASDPGLRINYTGKYFDSHLFIPQALADIKISFTVTYYDGNNQIVSKDYNNVSLAGSIKDENANLTHWLPGFHYKYTAYLPVDPNEIVFNVTAVDGWAEREVDDDEPEDDVEY